MDRQLLFTDLKSSQDNVVYMLLTKQIGQDSDKPETPYIDGSAFSEEMYWHKSQGRDIHVKINSIGGNVLQGWTIMDAVSTTKATTHLIGLGASMAGIIFLAGENRIAESHSTLMLHAPHGGGERYREIVRSQFMDILKAKTKLSSNTIDGIMEKGDHYFDISDMENFGMVDSIKTSSKKQPMLVNKSVSELFNVYNSLIDNSLTTKNNDMDLFSKIFGGKDDNETLTNALNAKRENETLKAKIESQEQMLEAKDAEINSLKEKVTAAQAQKAKDDATTLIKNAIKDGKIQADAEKEAKLIESAEKDYDGMKAMIDSMVVSTKKKVSSVSASIEDEKIESMTYEELAKNHPDKLRDIAENNPELFDRLTDEHLKKTTKK